MHQGESPTQITSSLGWKTTWFNCHIDFFYLLTGAGRSKVKNLM